MLILSSNQVQCGYSWRRDALEIVQMWGQETVTPRPWAVEVVTVTDADTSTNTAAGSDDADGARITTPTEDTLRGSELTQDERQRMRQTVGMAERIQSAQRTQSASAGTTHRTA